jgi:hypothetical protein
VCGAGAGRSTLRRRWQRDLAPRIQIRESLVLRPHCTEPCDVTQPKPVCFLDCCPTLLWIALPCLSSESLSVFSFLLARALWLHLITQGECCATNQSVLSSVRGNRVRQGKGRH